MSAGVTVLTEGMASRHQDGPALAALDMLQRYKLRLSDGTLLVVDHDALSSWVVDGKAMVQPVGSDRWLSLSSPEPANPGEGDRCPPPRINAQLSDAGRRAARPRRAATERT